MLLTLQTTVILMWRQNFHVLFLSLKVSTLVLMVVLINWLFVIEMIRATFLEYPSFEVQFAFIGKPISPCYFLQLFS